MKISEQESFPHQPKTTLFDKSEDSWRDVQNAVKQMAQEAFHVSPDQPLLGETDQIIFFNNTEEAFRDPTSTVVLLWEETTPIGYSLAAPIDRMDPTRKNEASDTAYIYWTVIHKDYQGRKLVGIVSDQLLCELHHQGYGYVERDAVKENGYADSTQRHYQKFPGSIVATYDHTKWPQIGPERFFRIDLAAYLAQRDLPSF